MGYLAQVLGILKSQVTVVKGLTSRQKTVAIEGLPAEKVHSRLQKALET